MTWLRRRLERTTSELNNLKSILLLLATAVDRTAAETWAIELEKHGFQNVTVEAMRVSLQVSIVADGET
jgi:hypothetical protein